MIINEKGGTFYFITERFSYNTVIVTDTATFGVLKVYANYKKYFAGGEMEAYRQTHETKKKVSKAELKEDFKHGLLTKYKGWTNAEKEELAKQFGVKLETYLNESKTCSRVKGYKKPSTNKRIKTYARKKVKR